MLSPRYPADMADSASLPRDAAIRLADKDEIRNCAVRKRPPLVRGIKTLDVDVAVMIASAGERRERKFPHFCQLTSRGKLSLSGR